MNKLKIIRSVLFFIVGLFFFLLGLGGMELKDFDFEFEPETYNYYHPRIRSIQEGGVNKVEELLCLALEENSSCHYKLTQALFFISGSILILCSIPTSLSKKE
ncbi:MAG: hypothetical protein IKT00_12610 [Prevotella sp.]|nr:hypothetical protein [Prevotella sp.]